MRERQKESSHRHKEDMDTIQGMATIQGMPTATRSWKTQ